MPEQLFRGIFDAASVSIISPIHFLLCIGVSIFIGLFLCLMVQWKNPGSESFAVTLALLPAAVCVVIMMVNGNIGTGVAVAGAFSLVRFRSNAGSGREIIAVFVAMGAGLIAGMGYLLYAALFAFLLGLMMMVYTALHLGKTKYGLLDRQLRVTIPENLNYTNVFDSVFTKYTSSCTLRQVRTTNMGSMFKLTYDITLRRGLSEKDMIDELRCLNGNLEISVNRQDSESANL